MDKFPGWRYGPGGKHALFESEADVPAGWVDHPSLVKGAASAPEGAKTAPPAAKKPGRKSKSKSKTAPLDL